MIFLRKFFWRFDFLDYLCTRKTGEFSSAGSEHLPYKQRAGGSNPSTPTKEFFATQRKPYRQVRLLFLQTAAANLFARRRSVKTKKYLVEISLWHKEKILSPEPAERQGITSRQASNPFKKNSGFLTECCFQVPLRRAEEAITSRQASNPTSKMGLGILTRPCRGGARVIL